MNVYRSMHRSAPRTGMRGVIRSLLAAEFGGGLVGDVGLVEAEGPHRGQVLLAADPFLQLGIHRIAQLLVFRAEGQGAIASVSRVVLEFGDGFDAVATLVGQALHGQLGADGGIGTTGAHGLQLRGGACLLIDTLHCLFFLELLILLTVLFLILLPPLFFIVLLSLLIFSSIIITLFITNYYSLGLSKSVYYRFKIFSKNSP